MDVGTGYYVQKVRLSMATCVWLESYVFLGFESVFQSLPDAKKHYNGKIDYVRTNLESLQETIQKKQDNLGYVMNIMQAKLAQSQGQASGKDGDS